MLYVKIGGGEKNPSNRTILQPCPTRQYTGPEVCQIPAKALTKRSTHYPCPFPCPCLCPYSSFSKPNPSIRGCRRRLYLCKKNICLDTTPFHFHARSNFVKTRYRKPHILCALAAMFELPRLKKTASTCQSATSRKPAELVEDFWGSSQLLPLFFFQCLFSFGSLTPFGFSHRTK